MESRRAPRSEARRVAPALALGARYSAWWWDLSEVLLRSAKHDPATAFAAQYGKPARCRKHQAARRPPSSTRSTETSQSAAAAAAAEDARSHWPSARPGEPAPAMASPFGPFASPIDHRLERARRAAYFRPAGTPLRVRTHEPDLLATCCATSSRGRHAALAVQRRPRCSHRASA